MFCVNRLVQSALISLVDKVRPKIKSALVNKFD